MTTYADAGNPDADYKAFAAGKYDSVLKGIVQSWVDHGFKTMDFRVGYEMNSPSMAWYAGNDAATKADWVAAFQHISTVLHAVPGADVKVVWNPNIQNWNQGGDVKALYPGNQYVDIIGADIYSPLYPRNLYDWALNNGTVDATFAQWVANPVNRMHYWSNPAANQWQPIDDGAGNSFSLQNAIDFATAMGKPIAVGETGAGAGGNGTQDVSDDPAFPQWLATTLSHSTAPVAFVNVWDLNPGDGDWTFSGAGAGKPLEAAAWAKYFGAPVTGPMQVAAPSVTLGSGPDSLVLAISEDAWAGDAQFTIGIDGVQVGGTQTVTASHAAGQEQSFTVLGKFAAGSHSVSVAFVNDAWGGTSSTDRNLYVDSVAGTATGANALLASNISRAFAFGSMPAAIALGSGPDSLVLAVSEDAWSGDAQFTVSVDGTQIGGVQTATASHAAGQDQTVTVLGSFAGRSHSVSVAFINDAWGGTAATDRNLYVDSVAGTATGANGLLASNGARAFAFGSAPATVTLGSGSGSIALGISEDAWGGDAQFTVSVDGVQIGGVQTASASHAASQDQSFNVLGNFAAGSHSVSVAFINDAWGGTPDTDRNLYVDSIAGGATVATPHALLASNGSRTFTIDNPAGPVSLGSGSSDFVLNISEDAWAGDAQFLVSVDGVRIGGVQTAAASHAAGQDQVFTLAGNFGLTAHDVAVDFINDGWGGSAATDRNLYVDSIGFGGATTAIHAGVLVNGTQHFAVSPSGATLGAFG